MAVYDDTGRPSWGNHTNTGTGGGFAVRKKWTTVASGWGSQLVTRRIYTSTYSQTDTDPVRGLGQMEHSSNEYVYVRGGGKYNFVINGATEKTNVFLVEDSYTAREQTVSATTTAPDEIKTTFYPVGSVYMSLDSTSPASFIGGTWEQLPSGNALWTTATRSADAGKTISAGLPNIVGTFRMSGTENVDVATSGAFTHIASGGSWGNGHVNASTNPQIQFNAQNYNTIYGSSTTVQPPAYKIYAWKRNS